MDVNNHFSNKWRTVICFLLLTFLSASYAQTDPSPIGFWQTYDLKHTPRSIIKISLVNDELIGEIVKTPSQGQNTKTICTACKGDLHNKPFAGLTIIWGLKQHGKLWKNGHVLDVDSGKTYQCYVTTSADNTVLNFSPYLGLPFLGTTLHWKRVDNL